MSDEPYLLDFGLVEQFYDLTIDRLFGKICTFAHVTSVYFATSKVIKEAEILQEGFGLILCGEKNFYRTSIIQKTICTFANATCPYGTGTPCT